MKIKTILLILMLATLFAQDMTDITNLAKDKSGGLNARGTKSDLQKLLEEKKDQNEKDLSKLGQYIPVEGSIVDSLYIVGPHDVISVMFITPDSGEDNLMEMMVNPDGEVIIPSYGAAYVSGFTFREVRKIIKEKVRTIVNVKRITVNLIETRIFRAHITGYVLLAGAYNITSSHRISDIIDFAGGTSPSADISSIRIFRDNDTLTVNLYKYLINGDISQNPYLSDGDIINIPALLTDKKIFFAGAVDHNGYYPLIEQASLCDYLPEIVDPAQNSDISQIKIIRNGEEFLRDITNDCSFTLKAGDEVIVPVLMDSVLVGGHVPNGGKYPYKPHATYHSYVAIAGGPTEKGSINRINVFRNGKKISKHSTIKPGDIIVVKSSLFHGSLDMWLLLSQAATVALTIYTIGFKD